MLHILICHFFWRYSSTPEYGHLYVSRVILDASRLCSVPVLTRSLSENTTSRQKSEREANPVLGILSHHSSIRGTLPLNAQARRNQWYPGDVWGPSPSFYVDMDLVCWVFGVLLFTTLSSFIRVGEGDRLTQVPQRCWP